MDDLAQGYGTFHVLGRGTTGTIYSLPDTHLCVKAGHDHASLLSEYCHAKSIIKAYSNIIRSSLFLESTYSSIPLPSIPIQRHFCDPNDDGQELWSEICNRAGLERRGMTGIIMDRVPSLPSVVARMLVRQLVQGKSAQTAINTDGGDGFQIQLQFGHSKPHFRVPTRVTTTIPPSESTRESARLSSTTITTKTSASGSTSYTWRTTTWSLRSLEIPAPGLQESLSMPYLDSLTNFPAPLPLLKFHLPDRSHNLVVAIAAGYAILHWACHLDGAGIEFVLGGRRTAKVWMLDFDKCRKLRFPSNALAYGGEAEVSRLVNKSIIPAILNGDYVPRAGEEHCPLDEDDLPQSTDQHEKPYSKRACNTLRQSLWETWKQFYIGIGELCCQVNDRKDLIGGPQKVCEALEAAVAVDRMGVSGDEDMVVFETDDSANLDDMGWGSDGEGDGDDDSEDGDDDSEDGDGDSEDGDNSSENSYGDSEEEEASFDDHNSDHERNWEIEEQSMRCEEPSSASMRQVAKSGFLRESATLGEYFETTDDSAEERDCFSTNSSSTTETHASDHEIYSVSVDKMTQTLTLLELEDPCDPEELIVIKRLYEQPGERWITD